MVPQQAWIYSGTVRENILFGSKYNKNIFDEVVESAALKPDLKQWPNGDQTEVGERGLSLSGGQKQGNIPKCSEAKQAVFSDRNSYRNSEIFYEFSIHSMATANLKKS